MDNTVSMSNKQLRWLGARIASFSMLIGCIFYLLIEFFPPLANQLSMYNLFSMAYLAGLASLFALPFSIFGGYALTWFLQKAQWYQHSETKVIISGSIFAIISILLIFIIGISLGSCLISHGKCGEEFTALLNGIFSGTAFIKALLIAAVCGGVTSWRLSRIAQQKTA